MSQTAPHFPAVSTAPFRDVCHGPVVLSKLVGPRPALPPRHGLLPEARLGEADQLRVWRPRFKQKSRAQPRNTPFVLDIPVLALPGQTLQPLVAPGIARIPPVCPTRAFAMAGNECRARVPHKSPCPRDLDDTLHQASHWSEQKLEGWTCQIDQVFRDEVMHASAFEVWGHCARRNLNVHLKDGVSAKQKQQSTDLTQFPESHERCYTVCVDKRTKRGHFTSAGNAAVRSLEARTVLKKMLRV